MERKKASEHRHIDRRSFLDGAGRLAGGGLTVGAIVEMIRPDQPGPSSWRRRPTRPPPAFSIGSTPASCSRFRSMWPRWSRVSTVASAALAGGVNIVEMGTPLLKNQGVANVVPAFRKRFPDALLLADMKTMDGGAGEARSRLCRRRQHP